jgi:hypothetical protein
MQAESEAALPQPGISPSKQSQLVSVLGRLAQAFRIDPCELIRSPQRGRAGLEHIRSATVPALKAPQSRRLILLKVARLARRIAHFQGTRASPSTPFDGSCI